MRLPEMRVLLAWLAVLLAACVPLSAITAEESTLRPGAGLYVKLPDGWVSLPQESSDSKNPSKTPKPLLVLAK
jgi:hypothetical protein